MNENNASNEETTELEESHLRPKKISIKGFLVLVTIWFVAVTSAIVGSFAYNHYKSTVYHDSAVPYLQQVIPEISSWDPERIRTLLAPEALKVVEEDKYLTLINWFKRLGELETIGEPDFEKADSRTGEDGALLDIVEYTVPLTYSNGEAELNILLLERDGAYTVYHFTFASERLMVPQMQSEE